MMTLTQRLKHLNWKLILPLALIALVRPLMSITGLSDTLGKPTTPIILTIVITIVWVGAVFLKKEPHPIETLVAVGVLYALFAIILSGILSPLMTGQLQGPLANPIGIISVLVTNIIWGLVAGTLATLLNKILD